MRWPHQSRNAADEFQCCEVRLVHIGTSFVRTGFAVLFGTVVHQGGADEYLNVDISVLQETTVSTAQHVSGITGNL